MKFKSAAKSRTMKKYDFNYWYNGQPIHYNVWSTGGAIESILFLGTVQIGRLPVWIADGCPEGVLVVQGAPHWAANEDGSDIPEFMYCFTKEVFETALKHFAVKKLNVIADSQAAPGVIELLTDKSNASKVKNLVLLQPLGLNAKSFKGKAEERTAVFKTRIVKNFRYQLISLVSDRRLLHNHRQLLRVVGYNNAKTNAQYSSGLAHDAINNLKEAMRSRVEITIICGENDKLFPPNEIRATLRENKLAIPVAVIAKVPHSPLATRQGMKLLRAAFGTIRSV